MEEECSLCGEPMGRHGGQLCGECSDNEEANELEVLDGIEGREEMESEGRCT